jgi:hypothetical protein
VLTCKQRWGTTIVLALISKGCWSLLIVASGENPDPVGTVACDPGNLPDTLAKSQQPDELIVAPLDGISCLAIAMPQLLHAEVSGDAHVFWHRFPLEEKSFQGEVPTLTPFQESSTMYSITIQADLV